MNYLFKTKTTMKEYNREKYWIDSDYIGDIVIYDAIDLKDALNKYVDKVNEGRYGDLISSSALKNKRDMFVDLKSGGSKQIGYVITGATDIETGNYNKPWSKQYIDLWVEILELREVF